MSSPTPLQWLSLVGVIWLQLANGASTNFPVYSSNLKHLLSISQIQLNNLAFASDSGKLLGWFSGVAAMYLPLWLVLMVGAVLGLVGYGVQFLFLVNKIPSLSYWQVFVLNIMGGNALCWINTVCYQVCIQNFPSNPRVAVGLSTSYFGLSAMVYTVIADGFFHPLPHEKAKIYLLLNAVVPMVITILTIPFVREFKSKDQMQSDGGFIVVLAIAAASGVCAIFGSIGSNDFSSRLCMLSLECLLIALLVVPITTQLRDFFEGRWSRSRICRERKVHHHNVEEVENNHRDIEAEIKVVGDREMSDEKQVGFSLIFRKVEFWLYFFGYMFGATVGLVFLNNLGQIVESRGLSKTSCLVSLASSVGFFSRLMLSVLDCLFSKNRYPMSRPALIAILAAPMAGAFFMLLNTSNFSLYISTAVIGACTGAITTIAVSATSELFGPKFFSVNHNIIVTNIPIGSFIFGYLAARVYQAEAKGDGRCMGANCYEKTFIIWGSLCSVSTLLFVILYIRTRRTCMKN